MMGILRRERDRRGPTIPQLKAQAQGTMRTALELLEGFFDNVQDGFTITAVKSAGEPLWKQFGKFLMSEEEVELGIGLKVTLDEEEGDDAT